MAYAQRFEFLALEQAALASYGVLRAQSALLLGLPYAYNSAKETVGGMLSGLSSWLKLNVGKQRSSTDSGLANINPPQSTVIVVEKR